MWYTSLMIPKLDKIIKKPLLKELGWRDPKGDVKFLVVTGDNAAGKSMLRRCFSAVANGDKIEAMALSMEFRCASGYIERAFVFNDESNNATGVTTLDTITGGIRNSRSRSDDGKDHMLIWDEPEIGMSEELQHVSCDFLIEELQNWPEHLQGVVIMTHSRIFVERLVGAGATYVHLGGKYKTAQNWLNRDVRANADGVELEVFRAEALEKFLRISKMLEKKH